GPGYTQVTNSRIRRGVKSRRRWVRNGTAGFASPAGDTNVTLPSGGLETIRVAVRHPLRVTQASRASMPTRPLRNAMSVVYTIGYEGTDINRFVATLKAAAVKRVADVRAVALSRKKGFSKKSLSARLEAEGIEYLHFIDLGDPKPGREAAKAGLF